MRRREFLIVSSVGGGVVHDGSCNRCTPCPNASPSLIRAVVYAPKYAAASELARQHATRGIPTFKTDECMVRLWRGPLAQLKEGGGLRIEGVTLYSDFTIARDCARDLGCRVLREEWLNDGPVALVRWLVGSS